MIAIKDTVAFTLHDKFIDLAGRFIILICNINSVKLTLVNVYVPNTLQICFIISLLKKIKSFQKGSLLICGDFNATANPQLHSTSTNIRHMPSPNKVLYMTNGAVDMPMNGTIPTSQQASAPSCALIIF